MIKSYSLIFLVSLSFCAQGMETGQHTPYSTRNDIGQIIRKHKDALGTDSTFYIAGLDEHHHYVKLTKIVGIGYDVLTTIQSAVKFIAPYNKSADQSRLGEFKKLLAADGLLLDKGRPLFVDPEVKFTKESNHFLAAKDTKKFIWQDLQKLYEKSRSEPNFPRFFVCVTPLQFAAMSADWEAMEWLIQKGANPVAITADIGKTPLELLISLVSWEQENCYNVADAEAIKRDRLSAKKFVIAQWNRMIAKNTPTLVNKTKRLFVSPQMRPVLVFSAILFLVYIYNLMYSVPH